MNINSLIDRKHSSILEGEKMHEHKQRVSPEQTVVEVYNIMKGTQTYFLPVYDNNSFIGVISLITLAESLIKAANERQQNYQRAIHDLRNPISNLQGLINLLMGTLEDQERLEILHLCNLSCKQAMDNLQYLLL